MLGRLKQSACGSAHALGVKNTHTISNFFKKLFKFLQKLLWCACTTASALDTAMRVAV